MLACVLCVGGLGEAAALFSVIAIAGHVVCWIKAKLQRHKSGCACHCHAHKEND